MPEEQKLQESQSQPQSGGDQPKKPSGGSNKTLMIVVVVVVVLIIISAAGYFLQQQFSENTAEKAIETATGGNVEISEGGDKVTIETDQGTVTIGKNELPSGFPSDISVYTGAKIIGSTETSQGVSVVLESDDSVSKVSSFYKDDLSKNDWKTTATTNSGGSSSHAAEKGDKTVVIVISPTEEGKSNVSITVTNKD